MAAVQAWQDAAKSGHLYGMLNVMSRYDNNSFLRLLDCYILNAIGELDDDQREALVAIEPWLHKTFSSSGSWHEMVAAEMDFADTVPKKIRAFWLGYIEAARVQGLPAVPGEFVKSFVSQNFPHVESGGAALH